MIREAIYEKCKDRVSSVMFKQMLRYALVQNSYRYDSISDQEVVAMKAWVCCAENGLLLRLISFSFDGIGWEEWKEVGRSRESVQPAFPYYQKSCSTIEADIAWSCVLRLDWCEHCSLLPHHVSSSMYVFLLYFIFQILFYKFYKCLNYIYGYWKWCCRSIWN